MKLSKKNSGFTLVEIAIVLVIVGLLLGGGINLLSTASDTSRYKETKNDMSDIKDALITYFVQNNGVLPCPDVDNNYVATPSYGLADYSSGSATSGGICTNYEGWLPHVTLGIGSRDAWGERYKYVVSKAFTEVVTVPPNLCTGAFSRSTASAWQISLFDLLDTTSAPPAIPTSAKLGDWAAFAIISTGKNGRQTNAGINKLSPAGAFQGCIDPSSGLTTLDIREQYHCVATAPSATQPFFLRSGTQLSDGNTVTFDDLVVWVGDMQLISELRKSGACK